MNRLIPVLLLALTACDLPFKRVTIVIPETFRESYAGLEFLIVVLDQWGNTIWVQGGLIGALDETVIKAEALPHQDVHALALWIDANEGGGTLGRCDGRPDFHDPQWLWETGHIPPYSGWTVPEEPGEYTEVCGLLSEASLR